MANNYHLTIVTPVGEVFNGLVESLSAHGQLGHFGVLAGHAAMISSLAQGILKVKSDGTDQFFVHQTGILEVKPDHNVLVLVEDALSASNEKDAKEKFNSQQQLIN
mgnify:CR=1 FL=1